MFSPVIEVGFNDLGFLPGQFSSFHLKGRLIHHFGIFDLQYASSKNKITNLNLIFYPICVVLSNFTCINKINLVFL